jgi:hypothetical protein
MKRLLPLLLVAVCGCSTAPLADLMDFACPPRCAPAGGRGGVCNPPAIQAAPVPVARPGAPEPPPTDPFLPAR